MRRQRHLLERAGDTAAALFEILLIVFLLAVVVAGLSLFLAAPAEAVTDDFGRYWFGTVAWSMCPERDQLAGLQFAQIREGMPGVWLDGRTGPTWKTGFGGVVFALPAGLAVRGGAGVADGPDGMKVAVAYGVTATWRRLAVHADYDTGTNTRSFGAGVTFWR